MVNRVRVSAVVSAVLVAVAILAGCSGGGNEAKAKESLNIWLYQKPLGLFSPLAPASGPDFQVMSLMFQSLLGKSPESNLEPMLAESMPEVSADAKTFTFKLREGLKWSDGKPFTSKDVLFTYTRAADSRTGSAAAGFFADIEGVKEYNAGKADTISGFSAPDDTTFVMKSTKASVGLLAQVGVVLMMPEHELGDLPVKEFANDKYWNAPKLALGPYKFGEHKTDQYVHMTTNPEFGAKLQIKDVYLKPLTADVATAQLGTGEIDIASISPNDLDTVEALENVKLSSMRTGGFVRMAWNLDQKRFKDPKVRQAFLYGIDRAGIVKSALAGKGRVRNSLFDPKANPDDLEQYEYDPEKAKQLLEEANFDFGKPVSVTWIPGASPERDAAATAAQDQLKKIGVNVKLDQVQASALNEATTGQKYDMVLFGGGDYAVESWAVHTIAACDQWLPNGGNLGHYCNKEFDSIMNKANVTVDEAERIELYKQAAKIENGDPALLWLFNPDGLWAVNAKVSGFKGLDPSGGGFWRPQDWKVTS